MRNSSSTVSWVVARAREIPSTVKKERRHCSSSAGAMRGAAEEGARVAGGTDERLARAVWNASVSDWMDSGRAGGVLGE